MLRSCPIPVYFVPTVQFVYFYQVLPGDVETLSDQLVQIDGYKVHSFYRDIGDVYHTCVAEFTMAHIFPYNTRVGDHVYRSLSTSKCCHM